MTDLWLLLTKIMRIKTSMRLVVKIGGLLVGLTLSLVLIGTAVANLAANEMSLNFSGTAYELNADTSGNLYVTDYFAGEIWRVNAAGTSYTIYPVGLTFPSDANPDNAGNLWWLDNENFINRMNLTTNLVTSWEVRAATYLLGVGFDNTGKPWVTDSAEFTLYSFDPTTKDACGYLVPGTTPAINYPLVSGSTAWLADKTNGTLVRLDFSSTPVWTVWTLVSGSIPYYLAKDASGNIWFSDQGTTPALGKLNPSTNQVWIYTLPAGGVPWMLSVGSDGKVWYGDQTNPTGLLGSLDPSVAPVPTPTTLTPATSNASSSCASRNPTNRTIIPTPGTPSWPSASYTTQYEANGWVIYQLPTNAVPYGISLTTQGFAVDSYRQKLMRFDFPTPVSLANFKATSQPRGIRLSWQTGQEIDLVGFNLFRADAADGAQVQINPILIPATSPGQLRGNDYQYLDTTAETGKTYYYWVQWVGISGSELYGPEKELLLRYFFLPSITK
jgi:streptogramin lyase